MMSIERLFLRSFRYRHLMIDLVNLLPHSKKESKFDSKSELQYLNELCDLTNCDHVIFFESRKHEDLYLWLAKAPEGPTFKFRVLNGNPLVFVRIID